MSGWWTLRLALLGRDHPDTLDTLTSLGRIRLEQREYADAEATLTAVDAYEKTATDTWNRDHSQNLLGASLLGQNKYAEAEPLLESGYEGMTRLQATVPGAEPGLPCAWRGVDRHAQEELGQIREVRAMSDTSARLYLAHARCNAVFRRAPFGLHSSA